MYEKIYYDEVKDKTLLLNVNTGILDWEKGKIESTQLQIKTLQNLIELNGPSFIKPISSEIKIINVTPYTKIYKKEIEGKVYLVLSNNKMFTLKNEIKTRDLDNLVKNGGVLITSINETPNYIFFLMPNLKKYEKNNLSTGKYLFKENDNYSNTKKTINNSEEYFEASIKLPRNLVGNNQDIVEQISKNQTLMREYFLDMNQKLSYINNSVQTIVENTKYEMLLKEQKNEILELHAQVEKLIQDRKILESEKNKAELIALNQIKQNLKMSILAVEKQIDLEDNVSSQERINNIIVTVLESLKFDEELIKNTLKNEDIIGVVNELSDNFDSKIQSLVDIKEDFIKNKIISMNTKGV